MRWEALAKDGSIPRPFNKEKQFAQFASPKTMGFPGGAGLDSYWDANAAKVASRIEARLVAGARFW
jgi:hypothetical protein